VRRRLLAGSLLLTAAAILAFFVPAAIALANAEREAQVVELQQEAADAAAAVSDAQLSPPGVSPDDPLREAKGRGEDEHEYGVYDERGRRTGGEGPARIESPLAAALDGRSRSGRLGDLRIASVPLSGGGAVRVSEPADEADERVQVALLRLAAQGLALLGVAAAVTWLLASRLTRPLRELGAAAARLGGGDFITPARTSGMRELDEVATALNATAERLGATVRRVRRLSSDTAHQLRTPLAGLRVSLEAELLQPRPDPNDALRDALGAVERLERTVVDLTELARDEVDPEPMSVADALWAAAGRWAATFTAVGRSVDVGEDVDLIALARRPAVDAILDVLIDNAVRHGRGPLTLRAEEVQGGVTLLVGDAGSSSLPEDELFGPRSAGRRSGIGLPLARTLAEAEGGRLRLISSDPTTFQLQLPTPTADEPSPSRLRRRRRAPD
jgi:signal transduction histidine kinase